jgi:hypothetical protein
MSTMAFVKVASEMWISFRSTVHARESGGVAWAVLSSRMFLIVGLSKKFQRWEPTLALSKRLGSLWMH